VGASRSRCFQRQARGYVAEDTRVMGASYCASFERSTPPSTITWPM